MTPYMAQGAANALEDAAVLSRCLGEIDDPAAAFRTLRGDPAAAHRARPAYVAARTPGASRHTDPSWVYGYDAFQTPLAQPEMQAGS